MSLNVTPPNSSHEPRYVGDIRTPHLTTPQRVKRSLNLAKLVIRKQRKILILQQIIIRLRKRIKTMKDLIDHL